MPLRSLVALLALSLLVVEAHAAAVPGTTDPSRVEKRFEPPKTPSAQQEAIIPNAEEEISSEQLDTIRFLLTSVTVEGSTVYSAADFIPLYANLVKHEVSMRDIVALRDRITAKYRGDGYVLSQAIVPPQRVKDGHLIVRAVEGYVSSVLVEGQVRDNRGLIARMGERIRASRPLRIDDLERYVLLIDDLPGVDVRTVLRPSPTEPAASELVLAISQEQFVGHASADNRGSQAIGPEEFSLGVNFNSVFGFSEATTLFGAITADAEELQYISVQHTEALSSEGTSLNAGVSISRSKANGAAGPLDPQGNSDTYQVGVSHPITRSRAYTLRAGMNFVVRKTTTDLLSVPFSEDRLRILGLSATMDFADAFLGTSALTLVTAELDQGLDIFNATESGSPGLSRANGRSDFTKIKVEVVRMQALTDGLSILLRASGQAAGSGLLSSEEFGIGSREFGRGYEPSEILGDHGAAGSAELRYDVPIDLDPISKPELYSFFEGGKVWNVGGGDASLSSAGMGVRFSLFGAVALELEGAKPLTRAVASRGDKDARFLFSVSTEF